MGPGFVILFWAIIGTILAGVTITGLVFFLVGKFTHKRWLTWIGGTSFLGGGFLLGLLVVGAVVSAILLVAPLPASWVYWGEFGVKPPPDVSNLKGSMWSFADSGHCYLRFVCSTNTVEQIQQKYSFKEVSREEFVERLTASSALQNPPSWWKPIEDDFAICYTTTNLHKSFSHTEGILSFNPTNGVVYYFSVGID
jgi:hypothetical protein